MRPSEAISVFNYVRDTLPLVFINNQIGSDGTTSIAEALKVNHAITTLDPSVKRDILLLAL